MYPSILAEFNIAPNTQIGRINIPTKVYEHENTYHIEDEKYSRGGEFIENMVTDNVIEYCHRWFHLGNIEELLYDFDEYYDKNGFGQFSNLINAGYGKNAAPIIPTAYDNKEAVEFGVSSKTSNPIIFYNNKPSKSYDDYIIENKKNDLWKVNN